MSSLKPKKSFKKRCNKPSFGLCIVEHFSNPFLIRKVEIPEKSFSWKNRFLLLAKTFSLKKSFSENTFQAKFSFPTVNFLENDFDQLNFFWKTIFSGKRFSEISTFLIRKGSEKCSIVHKPKLGFLHLFLKLFFASSWTLQGTQL